MGYLFGGENHMLLILIPTAWITIVALVLIVCLAAARGDAAPAQVVETADRPPRPRVVVWEAAAAPPTVVHRARQRPPLAAGRRVRDRRPVHGVR
jgi:hypothetical protein